MFDFFTLFMWITFGIVVLAFVGFILSVKKSSSVLTNTQQKSARAKRK